MRVTLLGTGSPLPDQHRAGPSTLVQGGGLNLLVDCGRGVLMRLAATDVGGPQNLHALLLTHLHSDHTTDLADVITTRWIMSMEPAPLPVVGPPGTATLVERTLEMLRDDIGYRTAHHADLPPAPEVVVHEITEGRLDAAVLAGSDVAVTAEQTDHRPVAPTVGYRVDHAGASVALAGDTVPCDGLDRLVAGADLYVQTVIRDDIINRIPLKRLNDICDYHSTVAQAAQTAGRAGVGTLVLTHMVPAPAPGGAQEWIDLATARFDGVVIAAEDLTTVEVGA